MLNGYGLAFQMIHIMTELAIFSFSNEKHILEILHQMDNL